MNENNEIHLISNKLSRLSEDVYIFIEKQNSSNVNLFNTVQKSISDTLNEIAGGLTDVDKGVSKIIQETTLQGRIFIEKLSNETNAKIEDLKNELLVSFKDVILENIQKVNMKLDSENNKIEEIQNGFLLEIENKFKKLNTTIQKSSSKYEQEFQELNIYLQNTQNIIGKSEAKLEDMKNELTDNFHNEFRALNFSVNNINEKITEIDVELDYKENRTLKEIQNIKLDSKDVFNEILLEIKGVQHSSKNEIVDMKNEIILDFENNFKKFNGTIENIHKIVTKTDIQLNSVFNSIIKEFNDQALKLGNSMSSELYKIEENFMKLNESIQSSTILVNTSIQNTYSNINGQILEVEKSINSKSNKITSKLEELHNDFQVDLKLFNISFQNSFEKVDFKLNSDYNETLHKIDEIKNEIILDFGNSFKNFSIANQRIHDTVVKIDLELSSKFNRTVNSIEDIKSNFTEYVKINFNNLNISLENINERILKVEDSIHLKSNKITSKMEELNMDIQDDFKLLNSSIRNIFVNLNLSINNIIEDVEKSHNQTLSKLEDMDLNLNQSILKSFSRNENKLEMLIESIQSINGVVKKIDTVLEKYYSNILINIEENKNRVYTDFEKALLKFATNNNEEFQNITNLIEEAIDALDSEFGNRFDNVDLVTLNNHVETIKSLTSTNSKIGMENSNIWKYINILNDNISDSRNLLHNLQIKNDIYTSGIMESINRIENNISNLNKNSVEHKKIYNV